MRLKMTHQLSRTSLIAACAAFVAAHQVANAAVHTWTGGGTTNNWNDANNWSPVGAPPDSSATELVYTGTAPRLTSTNTVNDFNIRSITFDPTATSYTITAGNNIRILPSISGEGITQDSSSAQQFTFGTGSSGIGPDFGINFHIKGSGTGQITLGNAVDNGLIGARSATGTLGLTVNNANFNVVINSRIVNSNPSSSAIMTLTKNNTGTLTLAGNNTYTGVTTRNGGVTIVGLLANGGTASNIGQSTSAAGSLVLGGGTLRYTGGTVSTDRLFTLSTINNSTIEANGTGPLTFSNAGSIALGTINQARSLTLAGTNTGNNTFNPVLANNGTGLLSLTKSGAGKWVLAGNSTYTGATTVNGGTLSVTGSLGNTPVSVNSGILMGTGTIGGPVTVIDTLAPGTSPGTLTINNLLSLTSTAILDYELLGTNTTVGGGINDLVTGVTNLTLDGTLNVTETVPGSFLSASLGDTWRLINYSGLLIDNGLNLGSMPALGPGLAFAIDTTTAGQVNLTIVPEPGTLLLAAMGVTLILPRRKRTT